MRRLAVAALSFAGALAPAKAAEPGRGTLPVTRIATFNASLNRGADGELRRDLSTPGSTQARAVAEIIQRVRPDILLLQEFDFDAAGEALASFQANYLARPQNGAEPIHFAHTFFTESNTGQPSGLDLNNDGKVEGGQDALGFGEFPGQYAMVLLSRFPIDTARARTFRSFLWKEMPGALLPDDPNTPTPADWYSAEELAVLPLSSKSHWDVPVKIGKLTLHVLASHPTPPAFDGPEDRNGLRNHDEIRFWTDYLSSRDYMRDDRGHHGGFRGKAFVLMGDQNSDPVDGASIHEGIQALMAHPRVDATFTPTSAGAAEAAARQRGANEEHRGDTSADTADFNDRVAGNLRVDYLLPSRGLAVCGGGVFWPKRDAPLAALVDASDHRLVWIDVTSDPARCPPGNDPKASESLRPRR
jgi:endonuclease/exonuclease/phosphatase family metal-dependent hydrolase